MPWQPPIPSGALYSRPARDLGPALALLAYCYDLVQRDGSLVLSLKDAAEVMEEPYPNLKRWWATVRQGPWFKEVQDRGKRGFTVTFKDGWVDWRVLEARSSAVSVKDISRTNEVSEMILDDDQGHFKDISRTNEGSEMILDGRVYKVLHDDQKISSPSPEARDTRSAQEHTRKVVMVMMDCGVTSAKKATAIAEQYPDLDPETLRQSFQNLYDSGWQTPWILQRLEAVPPTIGQPYAPSPPPQVAPRGTGPPAPQARTPSLPAELAARIQRSQAK